MTITDTRRFTFVGGPMDGKTADLEHGRSFVEFSESKIAQGENPAHDWRIYFTHHYDRTGPNRMAFRDTKIDTFASGPIISAF